jgi:hypothetical protein
MKTIGMLSLLCAGLLLLCPGTLLAWTAPKPEELAMTCPDWCRDADAIALNRSADCQLDLTPHGWLMTWNWSVRLKVLTEEGKKHGEYRIEIPFSAKLKEVNARTITPTGEVVKVKQAEIYAKRIYVGEGKEHRREVREFAFPAVTAGAILEVTWTVYSDNVSFVEPYYFDEADMPTCSSRFSFTFPRGVKYQLSQMNCAPYGYESSRDEIVTTDGPLYVFTAKCSRMNVDLSKPCSPGGGFARPQAWMVFAHYTNAYVDFDIVPDWEKAANIMSKFYAGFSERSRRLKPLYERLAGGETDQAAIVNRLFEWVADSLEFVDSRLFWDVDQSIDDKLKAGTATGAEKVLILQQLLKAAGEQSHVMLVVPVTQSPGVTRIPALTQFTDILLAWDHDSIETYLDPTERRMPFGLVPWACQNAIGLPLIDGVDGLARVNCDPQKNVVLEDVQCVIDRDGAAAGSVLITLSDQHTIRHRRGLAVTDTAKYAEYAAVEFGGQLTKDDITNVRVREDSVNRARMYVEFDFRKPNVAQQVGTDLVLKPNFVEFMQRDLLPFDDQRLTELHFPYAQTRMTSVHLTFPEEMQLADTAWAARVSSPNGLSYQASLTADPSVRNGALYQRRYKREGRIFEASEYNKLRDLFNEMADHDATQIVIRAADQLLKR